MHGSYKGEGIVLKRKNYSEADRIITFYTKDTGKITLLAKGVRRPKSRKRGSLEIFSFVKFQAIKTKALDMVVEAQIVDDFAGIRDDLKKVALAYYFVEVVDKIVKDGQENYDLFNLLNNSLKDLERSGNYRKQKDNFINLLLVDLGFWPKDKRLSDPEGTLAEIIEKTPHTPRIGKRILEGEI